MEFVVFDGKIKRSTRITLCRRVATVGRSGPESLSTARCGAVFFFRDRVCRGDVRGDEGCSGTGRNLGNPKGGPLVVVTSEAYYTELLLVRWSC